MYINGIGERAANERNKQCNEDQTHLMPYETELMKLLSKASKIVSTPRFNSI